MSAAVAGPTFPSGTDLHHATGRDPERWVPRRRVGGAARTPPTSTPRRPGRPGPAARQAVLRRSAPRPSRAPPHLLDQAAQDVVVERELTDLALRVSELALLHRPRPALQ